MVLASSRAGSSVRRHVFAVGDVGLPEECRPDGVAGKHLMALIDAATSSHSSSSNARPYGIELLRHASLGTSLATLGADPACRHLPSLDGFVQLQGHSSTPVNVVKAASGKYHSLLLLSLGHALVLSQDPSENGTALTLGQADDATGIQDVAAGRSHFVVCTDVGSVFTFGWSNEFGQLGDGTVWRVEPPPSPERSTASSAARVVAPMLTDPKRIPGFGISAGAADTSSSAPPLIIAVAAGENHSVLLAASKTAVYCCGRGHRGQLGTCRKVDLSTSFHVVQRMFGTWMSAVAAAADHTLLLLDSGKLVAFGDNTTGAACTGTPQCALEPHEAVWLPTTDEDDHRRVDNNNNTKNSTVVAAPPSESPNPRRRAVDEKAMESIRAPYGSVESFLYPRRVFRFPADLSSNGEGRRCAAIASVTTSATLTIVTTADQELFSAGLRMRADPIRQRADGRGHLGRHASSSKDGRCLGSVSLRRCSTSAQGGWRAICGEGFSAFLDTASGTLRLHGTVAGVLGGPTLSSLDPTHVATYQSPADDSIVLDVGASRRVVAAVAVHRGMLLVVEE